MKYKVGTTGDEIEVGQYREINKGSLKAFFSLVEYSAQPNVKARKTLDCRYFIQGDKRWFSFPQKEIKYTDGRKTDFIPLVSYMDKDYLNLLKAAILEALKHIQPEVTHEQQEQAQPDTRQANPLPSMSQANPAWPPF